MIFLIKNAGSFHSYVNLPEDKPWLGPTRVYVEKPLDNDQKKTPQSVWNMLIRTKDESWGFIADKAANSWPRTTDSQHQGAGASCPAGHDTNGDDKAVWPTVLVLPKRFWSGNRVISATVKEGQGVHVKMEPFVKGATLLKSFGWLFSALWGTHPAPYRRRWCLPGKWSLTSPLTCRTKRKCDWERGCFSPSHLSRILWTDSKGRFSRERVCWARLWGRRVSWTHWRLPVLGIFVTVLNMEHDDICLTSGNRAAIGEPDFWQTHIFCIRIRLYVSPPGRGS